MKTAWVIMIEHDYDGSFVELFKSKRLAQEEFILKMNELVKEEGLSDSIDEEIINGLMDIHKKHNERFELSEAINDRRAEYGHYPRVYIDGEYPICNVVKKGFRR